MVDALIKAGLLVGKPDQEALRRVATELSANGEGDETNHVFCNGSYCMIVKAEHLDNSGTVGTS